MLKRRIRILAVTGITIVTAIVFTTLGATGARAASAAPAASHCVEIELGNTGLHIWDNGPGQQVTLVNSAGSCWYLRDKFTASYPTIGTYTGYEYQDLRGDCLWDDNAIIKTTGPCQQYSRGESFFGTHYYHKGHNSPGWTIADKAYGPYVYMATEFNAGPKDTVFMIGSADEPYFSTFWNFP